MISFMADVIGIRDDMYIGKGHTYQKEVVEAVTEGYKDGVLEQKRRWSTSSATSTTRRSAWRTCCTSSTSSAAWRT